MKEPSKSPIKEPVISKAREGPRAMFEAITSLIPPGGALVRLYRFLFPPKADLDRREWQGAITQRSNEHSALLEQHEEIIAPKVTLSPSEVELMSNLLRDCSDGLCTKRYELPELRARFPEQDDQTIRDTVVRLKSLGLIRREYWIGGWAVSLNDASYTNLDRHVMGWDPREDA